MKSIKPDSEELKRFTVNPNEVITRTTESLDGLMVALKERHEDKFKTGNKLVGRASIKNPCGGKGS